MSNALCVCVFVRACVFSGEDVLVEEQVCLSLEMKYLPNNSIFSWAQPARQGHKTHKYTRTNTHMLTSTRWTVIARWVVLAERKLPFMAKFTNKVEIKLPCVANISEWKIAIWGKVEQTAEGKFIFVAKLTILWRDNCHSKTFCRKRPSFSQIKWPVVASIYQKIWQTGSF